MRTILIALALLAGLGPALAQTKPPLKIFQPRTDATDGLQIGGGAGGIFNRDGGGLQSLIGAFDDKLLPDLKYAFALVKDSDDPNDKLTAVCWNAWIERITQRKQAVVDEQGKPFDLPEPHVITEFQRILILRNSLRPGSKFMLACQPVASLVRQDIAQLVGLVLGGGVGLLKMVPGL